jgi:RHS repeat-associated protein
VVFALRIDDAWGDCQQNDLDTHYSLGSWHSGWEWNDTNVNIAPKPVTASCNTTSSAWFTESDPDADGIPLPNDDPNAGRGSLSLSWPQDPIADGYRIYMDDGNQMRQVGTSTGKSSTSWSTAAEGIYPSDSTVASLPAEYPGNPFASATCPSADSHVQTLSLTGQGGAGVVASDENYVYARAWSTYPGPTTWTRYDKGGGTGTAVGPSFAAKPILSAFQAGGYLYNGYADTQSTLTRIALPAGSASTFSLTNELLARDTGNELTGASNNLLIAGDEGHLYSVAYGRGSAYSGYRVREFAIGSSTGTWTADHDIKDSTGDYITHSPYIDGVIVSGGYMYLIEWYTGYRVVKIRMSDWTACGEWVSDQATTRVINGCWDEATSSFYLGSLDLGQIHRYSAIPGMDLRDDPRQLYAKTAGSQFDADYHYRFKVVPYDDYAGDVSIAEAPTATAAFENRTAGVYSEPHHTEHDLGEALRHQARVLMDKKCLELDITDLSIASWGPEASLARHYSSSSTETGLFAPGWRFSFEESLEVSSSVITWADASGERRAFRLGGGQWTSPIGCRETLSSTGNGWRISYVGGDHTDFDVTGRLEAKYDANGNKVTYLWGPSSLMVIAANGQVIDVALDGTRPIGASYATSDGTRTVTYSAPLASGDATATFFGGSNDEIALSYIYYNGRLQAISGPLVPIYLGDSGIWCLNLSDQDSRIEWWSGQNGPGYSHVFEFASQEATITEYRETIDGSNQCSLASQRFEANPDGTLARSSSILAGSYKGPVGEFVYGSQTYDVNGRVTRSVDMSGAVTASEYDDRGNLIKTTGPVGDVSTYAYDSLDRCVSEIDPLGSTTCRTFDTSGNVTAEEKVLNVAGDRSRTERSYDADGRGLLATESVKLDASNWAVTDYSNYASNGEPQSTTARDVETKSGTTSDLVTTREYDEFGNLIWEKDASGVYSQRNNVYSVSGLLLSSEADTGTITHHVYDALGHERETSVTAGSQVLNWRRFAPEIRGLITCQVRLNAAGGPSEGGVTEFDGHGMVLSEPVDGVGSVRRASSYDAAGRTVKEWAPGSADGQPESSTRTAYDVEGRAISVVAPGLNTSQATTTTYDLGGRVTRVDSPDGTWVEYDHDPAGNVVEERRSGAIEPKTNVYDLAGRLVSSTNEDGATTASSYDLGSRLTSSGIGEGESTTIYNKAGWVLEKTDSDGIATTYEYDKAGRVVRSTVGSDTTLTDYDSLGRVRSVSRSDGRATSFAYDAFGHMIDESQTVSGAPFKRTQTSFDEFDRVVARTESQTAGGVITETAYNGMSDTPSSMTKRYANVVGTTSYNPATGLEVSAQTTRSENTILRTVLSRDTQSRMISANVQVNAGTSWSTSWVYDAAGKLSSIDGLGFTSAGADFIYENGRKDQETLALSWPSTRTGAYAYTDAGRLSSATIDGATTTYSFDAAGNITGTKPSGEATTTLTYTDNRLASMGSTAFGWDAANGRRTSMRRSGESSTTYSYTESGALEQFTRPTADATLSASFSYDASGQRTQSVERAETSTSSVETTTSWTYDGLNLLSLAAVRSDDATWSITYIYDERSRPYAGIYSSNESTTSTVFLIVTTDRGDVIELVDSSGTAFATYGYDAWGNPVAASTRSTNTAQAPYGVQLALRQPLRYAGYAFDTQSGLYYCSQRYYDPVTMQWMTKDPARADGEESAYQYCGGDPVGRVDPSGLVTIHSRWGYLAAKGGPLWGGLDSPQYASQVFAYLIVRRVDPRIALAAAVGAFEFSEGRILTGGTRLGVRLSVETFPNSNSVRVFFEWQRKGYLPGFLNTGAGRLRFKVYCPDPKLIGTGDFEPATYGRFGNVFHWTKYVQSSRVLRHFRVDASLRDGVREDSKRFYFFWGGKSDGIYPSTGQYL